jgi:hypothetical protein
MPSTNSKGSVSVPRASTESQPSERKQLTPAAQRALREAEERRRAREKEAAPAPPEVGGRNGPDPVRYGDWERNGIASDF